MTVKRKNTPAQKKVRHSKAGAWMDLSKRDSPVSSPKSGFSKFDAEKQQSIIWEFIRHAKFGPVLRPTDSETLRLSSYLLQDDVCLCFGNRVAWSISGCPETHQVTQVDLGVFSFCLVSLEDRTQTQQKVPYPREPPRWLLHRLHLRC